MSRAKSAPSAKAERCGKAAPILPLGIRRVALLHSRLCQMVVVGSNSIVVPWLFSMPRLQHAGGAWEKRERKGNGKPYRNTFPANAGWQPAVASAATRRMEMVFRREECAFIHSAFRSTAPARKRKRAAGQPDGAPRGITAWSWGRSRYNRTFPFL